MASITYYGHYGLLWPLWRVMDLYGLMWPFVAFYGPYGKLWPDTVFYGVFDLLWSTVAFYGPFGLPQPLMACAAVYGPYSIGMAFKVLWPSIAVYGPIWPRPASHGLYIELGCIPPSRVFVALRLLIALAALSGPCGFP